MIYAYAGGFLGILLLAVYVVHLIKGNQKIADKIMEQDEKMRQITLDEKKDEKLDIDTANNRNKLNAWLREVR